MQVQENYSLKPLNTFGIDVKARYFGNFQSPGSLTELLSQAQATAGAKLPTLVLGGGSNLLFTNDFDGLVLKNQVKGIEKVSEDADTVLIRVGAGENWHNFVLHCIKNKWAGLENLSLIPGCVGASPMQNIGAYGVEVKDVFHQLTAFHLQEKCNYTFSLKDCDFGYRNSVFKNKYRDQFAILSVTFKLNKIPVYNTSYGAIEQELERMGVKEINIDAISKAVISIRSSKLPDPKEIGNAGSFFKNPLVTKAEFLSLREQYPDMPGYENADEMVKLAAGWLIEHSGPTYNAGWKGFRRGDAGVHAKQALVLVNYGAATGQEIYELSSDILQSVWEKFGVTLEREVNIL